MAASAYFIGHYATLKTHELQALIRNAPRFADHGIAPPDWRERVEAAKAVVAMRHGQEGR